MPKGSIAFVPTYRYPIGDVSMEFPRGGCGADEVPAIAARRELREETGFDCALADMRSLGAIHPDTGLIESAVHVFAAEIRSRESSISRSTARPEAMESVAEPIWVPYTGLCKWLQGGNVGCGVTLAALALALADKRPIR